MKNPILSICIPTYNKLEIFKASLYYACEASLNFSIQTEIIIYENPSETSCEMIVNEFSEKYRELSIRYKKNDINIGLAKNFVKVVENASGKYCWIIGDDDFLKLDAVEILLNTIVEYKPDLIIFPFDHKLILKEGDFISSSFFNEMAAVQNKSTSYNYSLLTENLSDLIHPKFGNVYLGSMMGNVFLRDKWREFNFENYDLEGFNSLESIYPHNIVFAEKFMKSKTYYLNKKIITVGDGVRDWSTDGTYSYWQSSLPIIYFQVIPDMLMCYKKNGLNKNHYRASINHEMSSIGKHFFGILYRKLFRIKFKNQELLKLRNVKLTYFFNFRFYKGIMIGILKTFFIKSEFRR